MISHSSFDFRFSNNEWCWASFSYVYVLFGEVSKYFAHLLIGLFSWYSAVWAAYIFWRLISLSVALFAVIFSHSEGWTDYFLDGSHCQALIISPIFHRRSWSLRRGICSSFLPLIFHPYCCSFPEKEIQIWLCVFWKHLLAWCVRSLWWKPTYIENGCPILSTVGKNAKARAWTREVLDVSLLPEGLGTHISLQLAGWIWDLGLGIRVSAGCFEPLAWATFFSSVYRHTLHWGFRAKTNQLRKCLAFFTIVSCLYVSFGCLTGWRGGWTCMVFRHSWIIWPRVSQCALFTFWGSLFFVLGGLSYEL